MGIGDQNAIVCGDCNGTGGHDRYELIGGFEAVTMVPVWWSAAGQRLADSDTKGRKSF